jgi:hypothetical protein
MCFAFFLSYKFCGQFTNDLCPTVFIITVQSLEVNDISGNWRLPIRWLSACTSRGLLWTRWWTFGFLKIAVNFLNGCTIGSFSGRAQPRKYVSGCMMKNNSKFNEIFSLFKIKLQSKMCYKCTVILTKNWVILCSNYPVSYVTRRYMLTGF